MRKPVAIVLGFACSLVLPGPSSAAKVDLVIGQNVPSTLARGQEVPPGTEIRSGANGLVVLRQTWRSNISGYDCEAVTVVGYGGTHQVADEARPGECRLTQTAAIPAQGQPLAITGVRYASSKTDDPAPNAVQASLNAWSGFESWVARERSNAASGNQGSGGDSVAIPPPPPLPAGMGALEYNVSYSGADYRDAIVGSATACSAICAQEPQCRAFTFIPDQSRCWLKSSVPAAQPAPRMISAVKR